MNEADLKLWNYNAQDCVRTFEIAESHVSMLEKLHLGEQFSFLQDMFQPVLQAMERGVRIDKDARAAMNKELRAPSTSGRNGWRKCWATRSTRAPRSK